jgi:hypothetical protein
MPANGMAAPAPSSSMAPDLTTLPAQAPLTPDAAAADAAIPAPDGMLPTADYPVLDSESAGVPMPPAETTVPETPESTEPPARPPEEAEEKTEEPAADWTAEETAGFPGWAAPVPGTSYQGGAPSGFSNAPPAYPLGGGSGRGLLDGFTIAGSLTGSYDTNVTQSPGEPFAPIEDDFITSLGANLGYLSKATTWTFGGNYRASYNQYFNNDEYSGFNHGAGLLANYNGGSLSVSANVGLSLDRGANRYYSGANFVEQTSLNSSLSARYRLSPKASLQGDLGISTSISGDEGTSDNQSFNLGASALWRYSPLTEFGPGLRYTYNAGEGTNERTSLGPTMTVNYKLAKKVSLNSRVGMDFSEYSDGASSDPSLSASIALDYRASRLWGMNFSLFRDARASYSSADSFDEVTAMRLGYQRKLRQAALNLGLNYEVNRNQDSGTNTSSREDRDFFSLDGALGMPVFSNTTSASIFMRYNQQNGDTNDSWDSVLSGFSLSRSF